jgi:putative Holliday junction resolvase
VSGERARREDLIWSPACRLSFAAHDYLGSMSLPTTGRLLAVDWGQIRIGLAMSDESQTLATPLETLVRRAGKRVPMPRLLELTSLHQPVGIVVGLPLSTDGFEEESAGAAREMAATIARRTGLPLELWDERMSTARALAAIWEQGGSTRGRKADVDALAAAVLLQHFLDARRNRVEKRERAERAEVDEREETDW